MKNCERIGCLGSGRWWPVLRLWADPRIHGDHPPAEVVLPVIVCEAHKKQAKVGDFLTDEGFESISKAFAKAGKAAPLRELAVLDWIEPS